MAEIMHVDSINALNAAILPILNGTVPSINVKHVEKQHQDMHHELVMDVSMMMEFAVITILMDTKMETSRENVEKQMTGSYSYLRNSLCHTFSVHHYFPYDFPSLFSKF
jgi:hypothetical protein